MEKIGRSMTISKSSSQKKAETSSRKGATPAAAPASADDTDDSVDDYDTNEHLNVDDFELIKVSSAGMRWLTRRVVSGSNAATYRRSWGRGPLER